MNKEVNFDIAKLLKDKEFIDKNMYGEVRLSQPKFYDNNGVIHNIKDAFEKTELNLRECYNAPTIAEVVMWLYEKHSIWIYIKQGYKWEWYIETVANHPELKYNDGLEDSPTEAYEEAIIYTLENLIQGGNK